MRNNATMNGIVKIENNVVIKIFLAANETSPPYSFANNTALFPTGIDIIINVTPNINESSINNFNNG